MAATSDTRALYAVLEVSAEATGEQIKLAYRKLALLHHPDRKRSAESTDEGNATFARIALAYEVLGHPQRRKRYDLTGELPQSDAALGREASETFFAEYVKSAPTVKRTVTNKDMSLHSLDNYEVLDVHGRDVPEYMRGIVMIGLGYLVSVLENMEDKEIVLLRHFVMDQMYALIAYCPPLDDEAFSERGYIITYYDHPLQTGIKPSWSDQNVLGGPRSQKTEGQVKLKQIDEVTMERRKLAALEWFGMPSAEAVNAPAAPAIPGEGTGAERLQLAVRALVRTESDPMSFNIHSLRRALEKLLSVDTHALDSHSGTGLMGFVMAAMDDSDDDDAPDVETGASNRGEVVTPGRGYPCGEAPPVASRVVSLAHELGSSVLVVASGRVGEVILRDPEDSTLTYKVKFSDGCDPATDWCCEDAVAPAPA